MSRLSALTAAALTAAVLLAPVVSPHMAAQAPDSSAGTPAPSVTAAPLTDDIHLDGLLDEPAWAAAEPVTQLTQRDPDEGAPPTEASEIRVLLGADALYVGARLSDREPARIRALLTRRDATSESDRFTVQLDSRHDHLTAFLFEVNPRGVRRDWWFSAARGPPRLPDASRCRVPRSCLRARPRVSWSRARHPPSAGRSSQERPLARRSPAGCPPG